MEEIMDKVVVVVFDSEQKAYEGSRAFRDLHREGSITLYADAVISKDANGMVALRRAPDLLPDGTLLGLLTGSLVGLLGGPVGLAVGAGAGTLLGAAVDVARAGIGDDFLAEVTEFLLPGKSAVIVDLDEEWQSPIDTRMETLGGRVFRRNRVDVDDAYFEKEIASYQAEMDALEAELSRASAERKRRLQAKVKETREKLEAKQHELKARIESVKREGEAKIDSIKQQIASARDEHKHRLEQRLDTLRADYRQRATKLDQAWALTKAALKP
jgi:uncharacterized membrane protein